MIAERTHCNLPAGYIQNAMVEATRLANLFNLPTLGTAVRSVAGITDPTVQGYDQYAVITFSSPTIAKAFHEGVEAASSFEDDNPRSTALGTRVSDADPCDVKIFWYAY